METWNDKRIYEAGDGIGVSFNVMKYREVLDFVKYENFVKMVFL